MRIAEHNKKTKRLNIVIEGAIKLWQSCQKLQPKYFHPQLLASAFKLLHHNHQTYLTLESAFTVVTISHSRALQLSWRQIKEWLNYLDRADILTDTLALMLHERTRFALLQIKLEVDSKIIAQSQLSARESKGFKKKENPTETQTSNMPDPSVSGQHVPQVD